MANLRDKLVDALPREAGRSPTARTGCASTSTSPTASAASPAGSSSASTTSCRAPRSASSRRRCTRRASGSSACAPACACRATRSARRPTSARTAPSAPPGACSPRGRDAQVLLETLDALQRALRRRAAQARDTRPARAPRGRSASAPRCRRAATTPASTWFSPPSSRRRRARPPGPSTTAASTRCRRACGASTAAGASACAPPARTRRPENLHEWRKRVKDLWHATQIVRAAQPKRLKRVSKRAHALADVLGDANDLAHAARLRRGTHPQCFEDEASKAALLAVIDRRTDALRDKALRRGRKLYKRSPKRFVRRRSSAAGASARRSARSRSPAEPALRLRPSASGG